MKLFGQYVPPPICVLAVAEFLFAAVSFLFTSRVLGLADSRFDVGGDLPLAQTVVLFGLAVVLGVTATGLYQLHQRLGICAVLLRLVTALVIASMVLVVVDWALSLQLPGALWAMSFLISFFLLAGARALFSKVIETDAFRRRVLVYGAGERAANLLKLRRRSDQRGFRIVGFAPAAGDHGILEDDRVTPIAGSLLEFARKNVVTEIVIAMDERRFGFPVQDLLDCRFAGIAVIDLLNFLERETGQVKVDLVNPAWLIFSDGWARRRRIDATSRVIDLVAASLLLLCGLPVMLIVAAAIFLEDGLPVTYRQRRVGLNGAVFTLFKFRSMVKDAEADQQARWAGKSDPRVTRVGKVIRKLRFDELPQLFNVLRGDMSLVGPRPERPEFVDALTRKIPYYHERHSVKPGITGWAQVSYPYGSSDKDAMEKLQFDLYYIRHRSVIFDLVVMLQTIEVVLWGKGAR